MADISKLGGNFGELMACDLESRSCTQCGRVFKVLHHSMQQECSAYCGRIASKSPKWRSWSQDQDYHQPRIERESE